jgi:hypothetical protein
MNQRSLRKLIRGQVSTGQLPPAFGGKTFGGRGRKQACDCCGQIIGPDEIEYQIEFTPTHGESGKTFVAHIQCHWLWWEESDSQGSPSESPGELTPSALGERRLLSSHDPAGDQASLSRRIVAFQSLAECHDRTNQGASNDKGVDRGQPARAAAPFFASGQDFYSTKFILSRSGLFLRPATRAE